MKSDLIINAEKAAREACEGLGYTLQQTQDFIDLHIEGELRRDAERAKELASAKRNKSLTDAIIHVAVEPFRDRYAHKDFAQEIRHIKTDQERDADTYQRQRDRGET